MDHGIMIHAWHYNHTGCQFSPSIQDKTDANWSACSKLLLNIQNDKKAWNSQVQSFYVDDSVLLVFS